MPSLVSFEIKFFPREYFPGQVDLFFRESFLIYRVIFTNYRNYKVFKIMGQPKVSIQEAFEKITEFWNPYLAGILNGQEVKLAQVKGELIWHQHNEMDELFFLIEGQPQLLLAESTVTLNPVEFYIVPKGTQHKPVAEEEVKMMLLESGGIASTGNKQSNFTGDDLPVVQT